MPGSISIDTLNAYEGSCRPRSGSWTIITAAAATLSRTSEAEPASQAPATAHHLRTHLPDTSADLTRNWLTTTAPPPFSRKGVVDVVMPVKATRSADDVPRQKEAALSTSLGAQQEGERWRGNGRHRHAVSQLQPQGSMRVQRSEEGEESEAMIKERTLGWVTLSRGMSTGSSHRRPGLRERKNNGDTHEDRKDRGTMTSEGEVCFGVAEEGDWVDGRGLRRKWGSFLKKIDKRPGKKGTL